MSVEERLDYIIEFYENELDKIKEDIKKADTDSKIKALSEIQKDDLTILSVLRLVKTGR